VKQMLKECNEQIREGTTLTGEQTIYCKPARVPSRQCHLRMLILLNGLLCGSLTVMSYVHPSE